jgi:serine palmitoyltransferase
MYCNRVYEFIFYEFIFYIKLTFILLGEFLKNILKGDFNLKKIFTNSLFTYFNYNNFRIVNSSVSKYINVQNRCSNTYIQSLNFGSYDYMGITNVLEKREELVNLYEKYELQSDPVLIEKLEIKITKFLMRDCVKKNTIVINGGYQANSIYLPLILEEYNIILSDEYNHASIINGLKYFKNTSSTKIQVNIFKSIDDLSNILSSYNFEKNKVIIITEGIFSMRGTILELDKLMILKDKYPFHLYIDEAHSIGAIGDTLRGICDYHNVDSNKVEYLMGTFSKTFNAHGSYISGPYDVIEKLKYYRNTKGYNTLPAVSTQHIISVYDYIDEKYKDISHEYKNLINYTNKSIKTKTNFNVISNPDSPIKCIEFSYEYGKIDKITKYCMENNIAMVTVGYPVLNFKNVIFRICLSRSHTYNDIDYLISCLIMNADKSKLQLPEKKELIDSSYINKNNVQNTIRKNTIGTAGPCGFFGYLSMTVMLEKVLGKITNKNTCLCLPHDISGYNDIFDNIIKRYNYKYVCVKSNINNNILSALKRTNTIIIFENDLKIYFNNILYIDFEPNFSKKMDCLKIMNDVNFSNFKDYKFVIGSFDTLFKGLGCFIAYNEVEFINLIIPTRTVHSSYLYSASLPIYIIHHNLSKLLESYKQPLINYN